MRVTAVGLLVVAVSGVGVRQAHTQATQQQYERWTKEPSNRGRWGADDEIGALHLITPAKRRQPAALVTEGVSVSLSADADTVKAVDNPNPYWHTMTGIGSDTLAVNYHRIAHTHLDSLAHINVGGAFYDGYRPDGTAVLKKGHEKNSIHNVKSGVFTRRVLEFLLTTAPLPVRGGTGSPVNPIATFSAAR